MDAKNLRRVVRISSLMLWVAALTAPESWAATPVTLAWEANPASENVTGYVLYHGSTSRASAGFAGYEASVEVGNVTQQTVLVENPELDHYFAVVARNAQGLASDYSAEVKRAATPVTPTSWLVVASATSGGSVSPAGATVVNQGTDLLIAILPSAGYQISDVWVDSASVGTPTTYTFASVSADHTLSASFAPIPPTTWTVTTTAGVGGSVSPAGLSEVTDGADLTVAITPVAGYQVADVKVDGASVGTPTTYTFASVSADHALYASFAPIPPTTWTVTTTAGVGGSVSPDGAIEVTQGANLTIAITPVSGYQIAEVLVDGVSAGTPTTYTFPSVSGDHILHATFMPAVDASLTPVVRGPVNGGTVVTLHPEISVYNPIHDAGTLPAYEIEVARDVEMTQIVASGSGITEDTGYTSWTPPQALTDAARYYWRARAAAGSVASPWSPVSTFYVDTGGVATTASEPVTTFVVAGQGADLQVVDPTSVAYEVRLSLPAGTLPYDFIAMVQTIDNPPQSSGVRLLDKTYEFGPHGLPLAQMATISLPYTKQDLADAGVSQAGDLTVFTYSTDSLSWEPVTVSRVDRSAHRLICEVEHFSMYAVGTFSAAGAPDGSGDGTSPGSPGGNQGKPRGKGKK